MPDNSGDGARGAEITRRSFFVRSAQVGAIAAAAGGLGGVLDACGSSGSGAAVGKPTLTVQSNLTDAPSVKALQETVSRYNASKASTGTAVLNTVASPTFVAQLPTYLTESNPPNTLLYWAGHASQQFGDKGYLLDLSSIWDTTLKNYPQAMRTLATDTQGKQIFVPQSYYWWGVFYRKSMFRKWGVTPPTTWAQFLDVCAKIKAKGVHPLVTSAQAPEPWPFVGWFDYLDLRINGAQYHLDLLHGKHSFDSPQVRKVFTYLASIMPYFDPASSSYAYQDAATPLVQGTAGMYLMGALITGVVPASIIPDLDFFKFPVIDASVPDAEEGPTNGYMAPAKAGHPKETKNLLAFLVSDTAQEIYANVSQTSAFPVSPTAKLTNLTPMEKQGLAMLRQATTLTQFFNRDSSDALQTTNYNAMEAFWQNPRNISPMLSAWQAAAAKVFQPQG